MGFLALDCADELIAGAADGLDEAGRFRIVLELGPQAADSHVDRAIENFVAEGVKSAPVIVELAREVGVNMPIAEQI